MAQKYGVKGYPSIKIFSASNGKKTKKNVKDYNGPRESAGECISVYVSVLWSESVRVFIWGFTYLYVHVCVKTHGSFGI